MEIGPKEARAVDEGGTERDDQVSGRSPRSRGHRFDGAEVERPASPCISEPDYVRDSPSSENRNSDGPRTSDPGDSAGPPADRPAKSSHRHFNPAVESFGILLAGRRLAHSEALGDNTTPGGKPNPRGRAGTGGKERAEDVEAEVRSGKGLKGQIGGRQRARAKGGKARESKSLPHAGKDGSAKVITLKSRDGETFSNRSAAEGDNRDEGDVRREGHSGAEAGGSRAEDSSEVGASSAKPSGGEVELGEGATAGERKRKREESEERKSTRQRAEGQRTDPNREVRVAPSEESGDEIDERELGNLIVWLQSHDPDNLPSSQAGFHLLLQAIKLGGSFGKLVEASLEPTWDTKERVRNLLPLPLWPDAIDAMKEVIQSERFKGEPGEWRQRGSSKSQASRVLRSQGLYVWHGLAVVALHWLHCGGQLARGLPVRGGWASVAQEKALTRIWDSLKIFMDEKTPKLGVPRTPSGGWKDELKKLRVSYTGEVIEKAAPLSLKQVLPGLPSVDHGGLVDILKVVDKKMRRKLQNPKGMLRADVIGDIPKPRVMCEQGEWNELVKAMYERRLVKPVSAYPKVEGVPVLNGAFGVSKPDKMGNPS